MSDDWKDPMRRAHGLVLVGLIWLVLIVAAWRLR